MTLDRAAHLEADQLTRQTIDERLDLSLFVEAGAGTGKTRALVDRYVALIEGGRQVEEIVAITFTEKAAAELRDRVRAELEQRLRGTTGNAERLIAAQQRLDGAHISTIHAFCANVLRSFAAESGIDPSFKVQDEVASERRFEERWLAHLERMGPDEKTRAAFGRILELGLSVRDLEKLAHELWANPMLAEELNSAPVAFTAAVWPDLNDLERRLAEVPYERAINGDELRAYFAELSHSLRMLLQARPEERHATMVAVSSNIRDRLGRTGYSNNWAAAIPIKSARDVADEVGQSLKQTLAAIRTEALGAFLPYVVGFAYGDSRQRLRSGELVFDDLILQVRNILRNNASARRRLRSRFCTLLIDEFQDTDPAQTDIALKFAIDPDTGEFESGRLFLVGDPKQSIYRFRRADMVIYSETRQRMKAGGGMEEQLALNRRSRPVVLDFVNAMFAKLIASNGEPAIQPDYTPIHPYRQDVLAGPGVGVLGGQSNEAARELRAREMGQIAAYCRAALDEAWEVSDRRTGAARPAKFGDIAVLLPTRTGLSALERALTEAGVPYRVEGGSLVYATQDVRDLINCLAAIDDPTDEVAIAGALRSPAFAISDVELARYKIEDRGGWDYTSRPAKTGQKRVAEALAVLKEFHEMRGRVSLAALIERFIAGRRIVEAGLYTSGSRDSFRRARFVIEQARAFEAEQPESLRAFVEWLSRRAGDAVQDYEGAGLDDDEDAVRILTIHASKGLEFPIVMLAGLNQTPSNIDDTFMVDRISGEVAVSIGTASRSTKTTAGNYATVQAREQLHDNAERIRLLYVAATRARDHLIISLFHKLGTSHAGVLVQNGIMDLAATLPELEQVAGFTPEPFGGLEPTPAPPESVFHEERLALITSSRGQPVSSATALGKKSEAEDAERERDDETEPWARGRAGTNIGRAVHAALQVLPWDASDATIEALADAQAVVEAIPDDAGRVAVLLRRALETEAAGRARTARRALREVPFAFHQDGVLLEGFIDLVIEREDGSLEVIDWKTDAVAADAVQQRVTSYHIQAGLYILGLEAATGRTVSRVTYVFVTPGQEVSPGSRDQLVSTAAEAIRQKALAG